MNAMTKMLAAGAVLMLVGCAPTKPYERHLRVEAFTLHIVSAAEVDRVAKAAGHPRGAAGLFVKRGRHIWVTPNNAALLGHEVWHAAGFPVGEKGIHDTTQDVTWPPQGDWTGRP